MVSSVQSLHIYRSQHRSQCPALRATSWKLEVGTIQWQSTSVCVMCKPPNHSTYTPFLLRVAHKQNFKCRAKICVPFLCLSTMRNKTGFLRQLHHIRHFSKMLMTAAPCNPKYGNGAAFSIQIFRMYQSLPNLIIRQEKFKFSKDSPMFLVGKL